jgi:hypothetical protein
MPAIHAGMTKISIFMFCAVKLDELSVPMYDSDQTSHPLKRR